MRRRVGGPLVVVLACGCMTCLLALRSKHTNVVVSPVPPVRPPTLLPLPKWPPWALPVAHVHKLLERHPFLWSAISNCDSSKQVEECYGELREDSIERVLQTLSRTDSPCALTPDASFYDVGSGLGRLAMYVRLRTNASRVVGIERNQCRHIGATHGKAAIEQQSKGSLDGLELVHADVRSSGLGDATHAFMSMQCWPSDLLNAIVSDLTRRAPRLRCMVFNARGARELLRKGQHLDTLDAWGTIVAVDEGLRATWTQRSEAVCVGRRPLL
jgi:hypothetical protein